MEKTAEDMRSRSFKRLVWAAVGVGIVLLSYYVFSARTEGPAVAQPSPSPSLASGKQGVEWEHSEINAFLQRKPNPVAQEAGKGLIELKNEKVKTGETIDNLVEEEKEESGIFNRLKAFIQRKNEDDDIMKIYPSLEEKQKEFDRQARKLMGKLGEENHRLTEREDIQRVEKATKKPIIKNDMDNLLDDVKQSMMEELKALEGFDDLSEKHKLQLEKLRGLVKSTVNATTGPPEVVNRTDSSTNSSLESTPETGNRNETREEAALEEEQEEAEEKEQKHEVIYNAVEGVDIKDLYEPNEDFHKCVSLRVEGEPIICLNSPQQDKPISSTLFRTGMWEHNALQAFTGLLQRCPACQAVDLGANLGVYTLAAAALGRQVLAVEPLPMAVYHLHKSVQLNGFYSRIILVQNALGDEKGVAELLYAHPTGDFGAAHTRQLNLTGLLSTKWGSGDRKPVRTVTLDQLSQVPRFTSAVLKMDVQGAESAALRHSDQFFQRLQIPYIVTHWAVSMDSDNNYKNMAAALHSIGYVPYDDVDGKVLTDEDFKTDHEYVVWVKDQTTVNLGGVLLRN